MQGHPQLCGGTARETQGDIMGDPSGGGWIQQINEFQIISLIVSSLSMSHVTFSKNYLSMWNSDLTGGPVFYLTQPTSGSGRKLGLRDLCNRSWLPA